MMMKLLTRQQQEQEGGGELELVEMMLVSRQEDKEYEMIINERGQLMVIMVSWRRRDN